ncbi:hypothetical protein DL991_27415 [Amycolatopsis sp. WAC 01375]|uniref:hypothetical protein n=1 Tax=unclassified Amycolatopsis TaxID=2618356 RepID=UPI000F79501A|nr:MULTISPECIES: hypothetical protein [unclassified Amycolatopsis]RSM75422.1 hypothetical protein DL991_27415 [Amycolatopsis sp. WAC 01375]RSN24792.1 hypothetical protein DL990_33445 [Amycolatopsis sp. WAC 01416]
MTDFRADPKAMQTLSEAYRDISAKMRKISELGTDRRDLVFEASGDDEMGEEIKSNLGDPVTKIEDAFLSIGEVVENQTNVTNGMAAKLTLAENENIANVHGGLKR